jgi:hypothetical protein
MVGKWRSFAPVLIIIHLKRLMKLPLFQAFSIKSTLFIAALVACAGCGEDAAREQAVEQAKSAPNQPPAPVGQPAQGSPNQPATTGNIYLSLTSQTATKGSQACLAVTARGFKKIVSMQYTLQWDKSVLKFREVKGFNLSGLSAANFGAQLAEKEGLLTHAWLDMNVKGIDKPDGDKLYELCFDVVGAPGSKSLIQFTGKPTVFEFTNVNSEFLELKPENGTIEVK